MMEFQEIIENNISAIITGLFTIFGAVIGALIGWGINEFSKKGKLKLINVKNEISKISSSVFSFQIDLWLYNSADNIRSINDLKLEIFEHGRKHSNNWICIIGETLDHYNFYPKQITQITAKFDKQFDQKYFKGDFQEIKLAFREKSRRKQFILYRNDLYSFLNLDKLTWLKNLFRIKFFMNRKN